MAASPSTAAPPTFGERLRKARKRLGVTQAMVAKQLGKTQPTIQAYESDQAHPHLCDLRSVARAYGLRPARLIP